MFDEFVNLPSFLLGTTLKGKNLLPLGANSFRVAPIFEKFSFREAISCLQNLSLFAKKTNKKNKQKKNKVAKYF